MSESLLDHARTLTESGKLDDAVLIAESILAENPNHVPTIVLMAYISWKANKFIWAYTFAQRAAAIAPSEALAWFNVGLAASALWRMEESESAFKTSARLAVDTHTRAMSYMNAAGLCIDFGRFRDAEEYSKKALEIEPYSPKSKSNMGFALLGQGKWEGWEYYSYSLGLQMREKMKFSDEPDWDFSPNKIVALYGEQGLGDEISFSSMIPDAAKDCEKVIFSCDKRMEGLFRRSFPGVKVYGTRKAKKEDGNVWDKEDWQIDASLALGELGQHYRRRDEQFSGKPFLVADPDKRAMWRTMFDRKKKPCIGIAWTGGIESTGRKFRMLTLEQLKPILESVDAHWVSLQYKDAEADIRAFKSENPHIEIVQHDCATLTKDYDDTAAMVSELDLVICIQTAVAHLAGALGKECWVMLPKNSQWRYGTQGRTMPWYDSLQVFRQRSLNDWMGITGEMVGVLRKRFAMEKAA